MHEIKSTGPILEESTIIRVEKSSVFRVVFHLKCLRLGLKYEIRVSAFWVGPMLLCSDIVTHM